MRKIIHRNGYFVSGTDTNVGKTIVSSILVEKFNGLYWKPIQCGKDKNNLTDSEKVRDLLKLKRKRVLKESFFFNQPISPNIASKLEKRIIKISDFNVKSDNKKKLIIEGAGGLMVPINNSKLVVDLASHLGFPVILVSSSELGTINHTLMSINTLKQKKIKIAGIVFIGRDNIRTFNTIENFSKKILKKKIKILARLPVVKNIDKKTIKNFCKLIRL